jgi:hypothetical protein
MLALRPAQKIKCIPTGEVDPEYCKREGVEVLLSMDMDLSLRREVALIL